MRKILVDTHTHTIASGHAYSTLIENCQEASRKGLKLIALTDHGPAMPGGPHIFYFGNLKAVPTEINGVEVLRGVEANIIDYDGRLDLDEDRLKRLDIVVASLHDVCITPGSKKDNTRAIIGAIKSGLVDIIAHPGNPAFEIDKKEVLKAAKDYDVLIEINNSSLGLSRPGSYQNCSEIASMAVERGNLLTLGSDAHISYNIGEFKEALEMLESCGVTDENIISTDPDRLKRFLKLRR